MRRAGGRVLRAVVVALLVAGCGSSGPDQAELRTAIDAHLANTPKCIADVAWRFPAQLPSGEDILALAPQYRVVLERLDTLARLGLVRSSPAAGAGGRAAMRYELTEAGSRVYREFPAGRWDPRKPVGAFCYGTPAVDSVVRYTEPADGAGQIQTEVTYTYRLRDVAPWARDAGLISQHPGMARELAADSPPREARAILVQASDGWRVATLR